MSHAGHDQDALRKVDHTIETLRRKGVRFWVEGGSLRYRARKGIVNSDDIACLRRSEREICLLLSGLRTEKAFEPCLTQRPHPTRAPLAFSQSAHWNMREAAQHRPIRQIASATRLEGRVDVGALREALSVVVRRHEALRTRIVVVGGSPMQEVVDRNVCILEDIDVSITARTNRASEIRRYIDSAIVDVADYGTDPLFRALLLRLQERESLLILAMDHIVSDGASLAILEGEILDTYMQLMNRYPMVLPAVGMQCVDYAIWQRTHLPGFVRRCAAEWREFRLTRFPDDRSALGQTGWGAVRFSLGVRAKAALSALARIRGTSITMIVLSVYVALVLRWCDTLETVVQVIADGRTSALLEQTVGYLAFPLYLHVSISGRETFGELLDIVTAGYCRAYGRPDYFYSYVQRPVAEFTRNTCFNWLPRRQELKGNRLMIGGEHLTYSRTEFHNPILESLDCDAEPTLVCEETADAIVGEIHFPRMRFSRSMIERLADTFVGFVDSCIADPTARICDVAVK